MGHRYASAQSEAEVVSSLAEGSVHILDDAPPNLSPGCSMGSPVNSIGQGVFVCVYLPTYSASRCLQGQRQLSKQQVGFGEEDQDSVPWLANERHASGCECGWRRLDIRDRDRLLLSSLPLVRTLCDHTERLHLKGDEAGRNAWAILR